MALEKRIVNGSYSVGQPLPGEQELASQFHVSVGTMRRALNSLTKRGLISRQRGRGTIVIRAVTNSLGHVASRVGSDPQFVEFTAGMETAPEAACRALELTPGSQALVAKRHLLLEDGSRIFGTIYWPASFCTRLGGEDSIDLEAWEREYERLGIAAGKYTESVASIAATDDIASMLSIDTGTPILRITRLVKLDNVPLEYAVGYCALKDVEFQFKT